MSMDSVRDDHELNATLAHKPRRVVFRSDATKDIGLGHVMRCIALGSTLVERGWDVALATANPPVVVKEAASEFGITCVPTDAAGSPDLIIVDGYHFTTDFYDQLDRRGLVYAVIDDYARTTARHPALIIDQNPGVTVEHYGQWAAGTTFALGLDFALVRSAVRARRFAHDNTQSLGERGTQILLSMGGSDPRRWTVPIARALDRHDIDVTVVVGAASADASDTLAQLQDLGCITICNPHEFVADLAVSAIAVVGAGTTLWESAALGTPSIGLVIADNQAGPAEAATALGFTSTLDLRREVSSEELNALADEVAQRVTTLLADQSRLATMSALGSTAVDGRGPERVADLVAATLTNRMG